MEAELFDKIAQTETSQGIIAVMKRRIYDRQAVKRLCGPGKNLAVLDRSQDQAISAPSSEPPREQVTRQ